MQDRDKKYLYPLTAETTHRYATGIFSPIRRGECVTAIWVPMGGRRMWSKFIIEHIRLFNEELPEYEKYILVYIEPLDLTEDSLAGYLRLMGKSFLEACRQKDGCLDQLGGEENFRVFDDESASYPKLLDTLKVCLRAATKSGLDVVFFLGEFDELKFANSVFFNNLRSLWGGLSPKIHYVFLMREDISSPEKISFWGDLSELILQNIVYIPLPESTDIDYILDKLCTELNIAISAQERDLIKKVAGSHPYSLKISLKVVDKVDGDRNDINSLEELLLNHHELRSVARGILDVQTEAAKLILARIASGKDLDATKDDNRKFLEKMGIISQDSSGKYVIFGELFRRAAAGSTNTTDKTVGTVSEGLKIDPDTGAIMLDGRTIEEKFTRQEYAILTMLLQNVNKLRTRDDIGEVLWGKDSYDKYSDWAIDQLMSKLRKKLQTLDAREKLITVRGKGYKLLTPSPV